MVNFHLLFTSFLLLTYFIQTNHISTNNRTLISADNVCTFRIADKLFSLLYLQKNGHYSIFINQNQKIIFDFCLSFLPDQCKPSNSNISISENNNLTQGYAFYIKINNNQIINQTTNQTKLITNYECTAYTSNSYLQYFGRDYIKHNDESQLVLNLTTINKAKATEFHIECSDQSQFELEYFQIRNNNNLLYIQGSSSSGCPVFQISGLWRILQQHRIIFGIILFILGFQLLFYGLLMINVTVFVAGYFISFIIYGGICSVFLGPNSSSIAIYFSLLLVLLASTLTAYGLTKLIYFSIFFIGACNLFELNLVFGIILGALINTIFSSIFKIHSVWSLVTFEVLCAIPFGLLTFKYANQIVILSTSLTGSYLIVRPISWIMGGFPNEFLLYSLYESRQISSVPWTFYLYLIIIVIHALMGASYQYLKLKRQDPSNTIMTNAVTSNIQQPLDKIKQTVDKLIARYSSSEGGQSRYRKMKQMENQRQSFQQYSNPTTQYVQIQDSNPNQSFKRKSNQNKNQLSEQKKITPDQINSNEGQDNLKDKKKRESKSLKEDYF